MCTLEAHVLYQGVGVLFRLQTVPLFSMSIVERDAMFDSEAVILNFMAHKIWMGMGRSVVLSPDFVHHEIQDGHFTIEHWV